MNYKTHNDLYWFSPLLEGNSPMSSGLILKMNRCYKGWAESSRILHGEGGNGSHTPCLKGRGLLQAAQQLDNYGLVTFIFGSKLYGQWGPRLMMSIHRCQFGLPWRSSRLLGVLLGSRAFLALRWTMLGTVLGDVGSRHCFTWMLSLLMWGSMSIG
jgi:hypothetical protein